MRADAQTRRLAWGAGLVLFFIHVVNVGAAGLWDPWETHYGEVARQIVVRSDPLDLWWQAGNAGPHATVEQSFASKPALPFWLMALGLWIFGVGTGPDPAEMLASPWPELALRLPGMLAGFAAVLVIGHAVWRLHSPRAAVLTCIVLATMPQWAMVTRQALTDMYFVAPLCLAGVAWALAWGQPDRELRCRGEGWRRVPWDRAYAAFVVLLALGALAPLAVLHHHAFSPLAWEMFGRFPARAKGLHEIQRHLFLYWGIAAVVLVASARWRRRSQAWMGILYIAAGLSLMGKGLLGPGLCGAIVLADLVVSGRWERLRRAQLGFGTLAFVLASFPWHHAMVLYRGDAWVNELILQNNQQRFSTGEQAQAVGSFAFYLETLGLAALPWSALAPWVVGAGLVGWARAEEDDRRRGLHRLAMVWLVTTYFVLGYATTKYYHYLLPALPPLAVLIGLALAEWLDRGVPRRSRWLACGVALLVLIGVVRDAILTPAWLAHLTTYLYTGMWLDGAPATSRLAWTCLPFAVGLGFAAWGRPRPAIGAFLLGALLTAGYVLMDYVPAASESWSQRSAFERYFAARGPRDRLVSWWFYYRGETLYAKGDLAVVQNPDPAAVDALLDQSRREGADALWFITLAAHADELPAQLPRDVADAVEEVYRSYHYALLRVSLR